jgi:hypothetical protein
MTDIRPEESPNYLNYLVSTSRGSVQLLLQVLQPQPLAVPIRAIGYCGCSFNLMILKLTKSDYFSWVRIEH